MGDKKLLTCRASAPGKVILHGEHSVVYGKTAIAASLDLQTTSIIKEFVDNRGIIRINFLNLKLENLLFNCEDIHNNLIMAVSETDFSCEMPEFLRHEEHLGLVDEYIRHYQSQNKLFFDKAQYRALQVFFYLFSTLSSVTGHDTSLELTVSSNLSLGSGIGSSASFSVSLAAALVQYFHIKFPRLFTRYGRNQSTQNNSIIELNEYDKNLISKWAFCCEKIFHGNPSGVDNEICCYGSLVEFRKGDRSIFHKFNKSLKICLVNTHVKRNTKDYVERVVMLRERYPDTVNSIMEACNNLTKSAINTIENIEKEENPDMCNNYFRNLSELFNMNHNLLKAIGVSHPVLEEIIQISNSLGFGGKLTGAGGGGNAIILIPPYKNSEEVEKLMKSLKDNGFGVNLTSLGGEGVTINIQYTHAY